MKLNIKNNPYFRKPAIAICLTILLFIALFFVPEGFWGIFVLALLVLSLAWAVNGGEFSTPKTTDCTKVALYLATFFMVISAVTVAGILGIFVYRLSTGDRTTGNLRQIQVELHPNWRNPSSTDFAKKDKVNNNTRPDEFYPSGTGGHNIPPPKYDGYTYSNAGELVTYNSPMPLFVFVHLWDAASFAFLTLILYLLRKFLLTIKADNPFTLENIKILSIISQLIIWVPLFDTIVLRNAFNLMLRNLRFRDGLVASYSGSTVSQFGILFAGFICYAIIIAFEKGLKLKEENDLTV